MKSATILLVALMLAGCNSPGVLKPLPYPEVMPKDCPDGRTLFRNRYTKADPCKSPTFTPKAGD